MIAELRQYNDFNPALNELSGRVVNCFFSVHKELGPGFLESNYEDALCYELDRENISFERQIPFKIPYKNSFLNTEFRFDIVVENKILIELKSVEKIHPVHQAQIYAYLKATSIPIGFLVNFNVRLIKDGIGRYVLRSSETPRLKEG